MSVTPFPDARASKADWRRWAEQQWDRVDLSATSQAVVENLTAWEPLHQAKTVLVYLPMAEELDVSVLAESLASGALAVTRTPAEGPLTIHRLEGALERHSYGYLQPVATAAELDPGEIDIALVPGRCFDRFGGRLGRGAGYYDVLLARMSRSALRVGVVPHPLVVPRLPTAAHDIAMTHLVTEYRLHQVAR